MQRLLLAALLAAAVSVTLSSAWDRNHIYCCKIVFLKWQTFAESQQNRTLSRLADQRRLRNCSIEYRGDGDYWRMYWLRGAHGPTATCCCSTLYRPTACSSTSWKSSRVCPGTWTGLWKHRSSRLAPWINHFRSEWFLIWPILVKLFLMLDFLVDLLVLLKLNWLVE